MSSFITSKKHLEALLQKAIQKLKEWAAIT